MTVLKKMQEKHSKVFQHLACCYRIIRIDSKVEIEIRKTGKDRKAIKAMERKHRGLGIPGLG